MTGGVEVTDLLTLASLSHTIMQHFHSQTSGQFWQMMTLQEYHGFGKSRLPEEFLKELLDPYDLKPEEVQIELARVTMDLTDEIHYHKSSLAFCTIMGDNDHVENPRAAKAFLHDRWFDVFPGLEIAIPVETLHGFTVDVEKRGILYFLSVQTPPIVRGDDQDDYHHPNKV